MKGWLFWYTFGARAILAAAYALGVYWIGSSIVARSPDAPVAAHKLDVNRRLTADDIRTDATTALIGNFLKAETAAGKPVTPDQVSRTPIDTNLSPSLAAIVSIKPEILKDRNLDKRAPVRITFSNSPQTLDGVLADVNCDQQICSAIVELAKAPAQTFGAFDFSKADIYPPPSIPTGP